MPPRPFVGRKADIERLEGEVDRDESRYPDMPIVVTGEAGIGKTSLVAQFVERRSRRERSIWIRCRDWKIAVLPFERFLRDRHIRHRGAMVVLDGADSRRERSIWIRCRDWKIAVLPFERFLRDRHIRHRGAMVVLDGADEIPEKQMMDLFFRVINFKLVRTLIITSRRKLHLRGQRAIHLERLARQTRNH